MKDYSYAYQVHVISAPEVYDLDQFFQGHSSAQPIM